MAVITVTKDNFEEEVLKSDKKVLIDFYADWCMPCKMVAPIIEEISEECPQYKICRVNVDEQPDLARVFEIDSIPALFVVENGTAVAKTIGARPKHQILEMLK